MRRGLGGENSELERKSKKGRGRGRKGGCGLNA